MELTKLGLWRQEKGLTYAELAEVAGCSRQYIYKLCTEGVSAVTKVQKLIIAAGYKRDGVTPELTLADFLSAEDYDELAQEGFVSVAREVVGGLDDANADPFMV